MSLPGRFIAFSVFAAMLGLGASAPAQTETTEPVDTRALPTELKSWTGDFDGMKERRIIRVAVPYSRSLYYLDRGRERGLTADIVRKFEELLNKKYKKDLDKRPITIVLIPTTRDQLIPSLLDGRADIAAGNITITESRQAQVDFSQPVAKPFSEVIVTGPGGPDVKSIDDLAGKEIFVRPSTSYYESLTALNEQFTAAGKAQMTLTPLPDAIEDEDKLDMVNAGLLGMTVVDEWLADLWSPILTDMVVHKDIAVRTGGQVGWAFRKNSPLLKAEIDEFVVQVVKKYGLITGNYKSFAAKIRKADNAKAKEDWQRFQSVVELFQKYAGQYGFDYLLLTAQGYQESQLDQNTKSPVGAIGVMQLMPDTGKAMEVGDIRQTEANVHAGAKYMDHIIEVYFPDAELDEENRTLFAFAAYNAGPSRMAKLRKLAAEQGYDPNKWFNNVERVVAQKVGQEPVTYVRNIYKYYVSYKLALDAEERSREAAGQVKTTVPE
ncbi:MAG TPA: transporter substrate-binding domain-containing protein [Verrucomicrobiae bacterium]|nr:transporter substrate-binding domain-containing protein [Verrucomicrobiae bacterium]